MTREQFLAGVKFRIKAKTTIQYQFAATRQDITNEYPGYIREFRGHYDCYHADVIHVTETHIVCYVIVLGEIFERSAPLDMFEVAE